MRSPGIGVHAGPGRGGAAGALGPPVERADRAEALPGLAERDAGLRRGPRGEVGAPGPDAAARGGGAVLGDLGAVVGPRRLLGDADLALGGREGPGPAGARKGWGRGRGRERGPALDAVVEGGQEAGRRRAPRGRGRLGRDDLVDLRDALEDGGQAHSPLSSAGALRSLKASGRPPRTARSCVGGRPPRTARPLIRPPRDIPSGACSSYRRSCRTACGAWLAWASIAVPACCRIWFLVRETISSAMSTSRMRLSAEVRFSW